MSTATTIADLNSFVREIMREEGVVNYDVQIDGQSGRGENYLGDVTFFAVTTENGKRYDLVMKTAKRSETLREKTPVESAYMRESMMYGEVIPEIEKFLRDTNSAIKVDFVPKIYWICNERGRETLIMENLQTKGFRHWDRRQPMDMNHALFIVKYLGKYHGTTMAMKMLESAKFEKLARPLNGVWEEFMKSMDGNALFGKSFKIALRSLEENNKKDLVRKFKTVEEKLDQIILGETLMEDKLVITHGDSWINNFLLGYEEEKPSTPSQMYFVDFQLSSFDSPVRDLSYFIYTACDKTVLDDFDLLLRKYHSSLSESLDSLGCNVDDIFSYGQLKEHWKKYANFGLILSTMIVRMELLESDEAPDLTEITECGDNFAEIFNRPMRNEEVYNRRMLDVLTHFGENFL
ncbi:uncharacterized protein LOC123675659 [Harmonia axyridis]|uniref:uncharacterized protein LOC123675659 n=1 Tax=Harmonia axyridis TaxID=115357 RepID=UPI001E275DF7|nr:uncharacterized protein LOC123675659 [Harmonia axyridis]